MGAAHSQQSASVRVSPVCGFPKSGHSERQSTEVMCATTGGSEPFLATASVRSIYKQAGSGPNSRKNSRRRNFTQKYEPARMCVNGGLFDSGANDNGALSRSGSKKKVRTRTLKQTSHNSTNSSYIADFSPDHGSDNHWNSSAFVAVNEHQLRLGLNRLASMDTTRSVNGHLNTPKSPKHPHQVFPSYLSMKTSDLPSEFGQAPPRLIQRRHLSELCLHLEDLYQNYIVPTSPKAYHHPPSAQYFIPSLNFARQMPDVGPFVRMANATSMYVPTSMVKSPSCQATPSQSIQYNNQLMAPLTINSPFGSEADLISPDNDIDDYHDYANLPPSRSRSFKVPIGRDSGVLKNTVCGVPASKLTNDRFPEATERLPLPSRRRSKSRWRLMSRGKNLTKSISCYALKFFGQQTRNLEVPEQPIASNRCDAIPSAKQSIQGGVIQRPPTLAVVKCGRGVGGGGDGMVLSRKSPPSHDGSNDLDTQLQHVLRLGQSEDADAAPRLTQMVSLQAKMNRSLSAFGNRDSDRVQQPHLIRRSHQPPAPPREVQRDVFRKDRLHVLQATTTKELLHCLSLFILQNCGHLSDMDIPLFSDEITAWIRDIDRALIQQGWTDVPFLNPANVVFLYILLKGFIDSSITCCHELHSFVMVCLYLSYGYMGNEISYPLKPFLNAGILFSMLHETDPTQRVRSMNAADPKLSRNPKMINRFRDAFLDICLRVVKRKSKEMLQLNSDAIFFTESITELRSYASPPPPLPPPPPPPPQMAKSPISP